LTEEEKKAKLADLREKLAVKRAGQSQDEVKANNANEVGSCEILETEADRQ
jgi:hypothetical protein